MKEKTNKSEKEKRYKYFIKYRVNYKSHDMDCRLKKIPMKYFYFTPNLYCADTGVGAVLKVLNCRTSVKRTSNNYILTYKHII